MIKARVSSITDGQPFELALSGGTDSTAILFACLDLGHKPRCLTFKMEHWQSEDHLAAQALAKSFGLEIETITIPGSIEVMAADVKRVLPHCHLPKKTIVQCMIPWLYVYPAMKTGLILIGIAADDLYCNQRKVQVALNTGGEAAIADWRRLYHDDLNFSCANITRFAGVYGRRCVDVYGAPEFEAFFLEFAAKALNSPYEKHLTVKAFRDFYDRGPFYRKRSSYQVNSKLRDRHEELLKSDHNTRHRKVVAALYRDFLDELSPNTGLSSAEELDVRGG